jgi:hypothetical protein
MLIFKLATYSMTIAAAMFFGYWELRLKRELTDNAVEPRKRPSEFGISGDLSERVERERILSGLPEEGLSKLRRVVRLKLLFVAILIAEVLFLQP